MEAAENIIDAIGTIDEPATDDKKNTTHYGPPESDIKKDPKSDITPLQENDIKAGPPESGAAEPVQEPNDITGPVQEPVKKVEAEVLDKKESDGLKFDFTKPIKDVRPDKYKNKDTLDPKTQAKKDEYFKIYEYYVTSHSTMIQLAEKYDCTIFHASRIIKWVVLQIGEIDPDAELHAAIDRLKMRKQRMEDEIKKDTSIDDKVKIFKALNSTDKLLSQLEVLVGSALNNKGPLKAPALKLNSGFSRRGSGGESAAGSDIIRDEGSEE